ncbi:MAG: M48 family metallopeptidase [Ectothiorhodospiraceae bacterium]|nr:M48 family metallopeptidase [Ectothiorhodospiraceae bacterium]
MHLNWHLIFAPKPVLEDAVFHALCHLRERNHDRAFWNLDRSILPDWGPERRGWTKTSMCWVGGESSQLVNESLIELRDGRAAPAVVVTDVGHIFGFSWGTPA